MQDSDNQESLIRQPQEPLAPEPQRITQVSQSVTIVSPYPPAEQLAGYESVLPGGADRLLAMVEEEQRHRHRMAETEQQNDHEINLRLLKDRTMRYVIAQATTSMAVVLLTVGGGSLIFLNKPLEGFALLGTQVTFLIRGKVPPAPKSK